jgi:hypothetical protein
LKRDVRISIEALALFVRFWLTVTPPLPDSAQAAANAKGRERFEHFVTICLCRQCFRPIRQGPSK